MLSVRCGPPPWACLRVANSAPNKNSVRCGRTELGWAVLRLSPGPRLQICVLRWPLHLHRKEYSGAAIMQNQNQRHNQRRESTISKSDKAFYKFPGLAYDLRVFTSLAAKDRPTGQSESSVPNRHLSGRPGRKMEWWEWLSCRYVVVGESTRRWSYAASYFLKVVFSAHNARNTKFPLRISHREFYPRESNLQFRPN